MDTTQQPGLMDRLSSFSPAMGAIVLRNLDQHDRLITTEQREKTPVEFFDRREEEFARMLDRKQISWKYKHRTFAVEWDEEGNFVDCFTPDFYMPEFDVYVALVATDYRALGDKARKVRLLRQQRPDIRIELLSPAAPPAALPTFS